MIITKIKNLKNYQAVDKNFKTVVDNIERFSDFALEKGKYEINDSVFAVVNSYQSAEAKVDFFENHHKYIDIQCILAGSERIFTADADTLTVSSEYDDENDFELFKTPSDFSTQILSAGDCAIFFPGEAHQPGVSKESGPETISKVIFKVKI